MKVKILHIIYSGVGGTADYVFSLIKGDHHHHCEHHILFYGVEEVSSALKQSAENISTHLIQIKKKAGIDRNAINQLSLHIQSNEFKVVTLHVNSLIWHLPKMLKKETQLIYVEHQSNQLKTKKEWLWSALAQRKADCVVTLSADYQKELQKKVGFLYKPAKNTIIRTGLPLEDYTHAKASNDAVKIGMVARINELKDHATLIRAFESLQHPTAELHIAGDGPLLNYLKAKSKSDKIQFHGMLSNEKIIELLGQLSIYVQATKGETSSIAIMQAQCSGLPIIASNVTGVHNVLNEQNAILVTVGDVSQMANALKKLIESEKLREKLALSSVQYAREKLDNKKMFADLESLIS